MKHPFDYHAPSSAQIQQIGDVREGCKALHAILLALPSTRERSVAITKLEEVSMWANKGIIMADEGPVETCLANIKVEVPTFLVGGPSPYPNFLSDAQKAKLDDEVDKILEDFADAIVDGIVEKALGVPAVPPDIDHGRRHG